MRKLFAVIFVLIFAVFCFGQETPKNDQKSRQRLFGIAPTDESYKPYFFEPYQADYVLRGKVFGIPLEILTVSTGITELKDEWNETQKYKLTNAGDFSDEDLRKEGIRETEVSSVVDLKTGLLKNLTVQFPDKSDIGANVTLTDDGKIIALETKDNLTKQSVYDTPEKIYPCHFSFTFFSNLPLTDTFTNVYNCMELGKNDSTNDHEIIFFKRSLRVIGTETVTVEAGTFECYKLVSESKEISTDRSAAVKRKKKDKVGEGELWQPEFGNIWIDKKTRKLVKADMNIKYGKFTLEMTKQQQNNLRL